MPCGIKTQIAVYLVAISIMDTDFELEVNQTPHVSATKLRCVLLEERKS